MLPLISRVKARGTKAHKRPTTRRATFERLEDRAMLSGGAVLTVIPGTTNNWAEASFLDSSGKLVVGGFTPMNSSWALRYANYLDSGTLALDPTFGSGGAAMTHLGSAHAAAPCGDKILLGGDENGDFALARVDATGSLDTTFGVQGSVTTDLGGSDVVHGMIVQQDTIVVAGVGGPSGYAAKLARYTSAGQLDPSFGQGGVVTPAFGGINSGFIAIAEDHGKILAAGGVTFVASTRAIALALTTPTAPPIPPSATTEL